MSENENRPRFLGTYFDPGIVFRIVNGAKIASWVILALYATEFLVNAGIFTLQVLRGFMRGLGPTDYATQVIFYIKQPLAGVLFFFLLQAAAQALLILLDVEANTRQAGRAAKKLG